MKVDKPPFCSESEYKERPAMQVLSLPGKGDPLLTFDAKVVEILEWLKQGNMVPTGPTLGIYYLNRQEVGVEQVVWEACVPVAPVLQGKSPFRYQELPRVKVASTVLTGGYDLIGSALHYLEQVAKDQGKKISFPLTEIYLREEKQPITELQYVVV